MRIATAAVLAVMGLLHAGCHGMPMMASTRTIPTGTWETRSSASLLANAQERSPDHLDPILSFALYRGLDPTTEIGV